MRLLLLALLLAPSAAADPLALQLFSQADRRAVQVGEEVLVTVEAVAVPQTEAARAALVEALRRWAPALGAGLTATASEAVVTRDAGGVLEIAHRTLIRVERADVAEIPALRLRVEVEGWATEVRTQPHPLAVFGRVPAAASAVVAITAEGELAGQPFERTGTAFAVGDDALATAFHVVVGARRVRVSLPDGTEAVVDRVWALDPGRDVAILHLPRAVTTRAGVAPLPLAPAGSASAAAFAPGRPGGGSPWTAAPRYPDLDLAGQRVSVSGNVVRPGDSGGPLLDERGRVLGVVVSGRGEQADAELLEESLCLASDLAPALEQTRRARAPVALADALAGSRSTLPGRVHAAIGALDLAAAAPGIDRQRWLGHLRAAVRQSGDPVLLFLAGDVLERAGDTRARAALAASMRRGYTPAAYALAHHLLGSGSPALAADAFRTLAGDPAYGRLAALGEAQALVARGRYLQAERPLATVLAHDARFAPALYLLGLAHLSGGRDAQARALIVRLADPEWADALRLPVEVEALRPPTLQALPRVAMR